MYIVYTSLTELSINKHDGYRINALFSNLCQLQVGDDVRVAGVRVGSVINTYLDKGTAVAVLNVEKRYPIPQDSIATILMSGLLGANYVAISPGGSELVLKQCAYIQTKQTADLSFVVQEFGRVGQKLNGFIDNCKNITQQLVEGKGTLGKLLMDDNAHNELLSMMDSIRQASKKVETLLVSFEDIAENIKGGEGLLGKLVSDETMATDFEHIVKNIRAFCEKLNSNTSTLGRIVSDDALYRKAEATLEKVEKAGDNIANAGPVTALGTVAGALF